MRSGRLNENYYNSHLQIMRTLGIINELQVVDF